MATFTNPETGKNFNVDVAKYDRMTTAELITEYDAINEVKHRKDFHRNQERINYIVGLISARADNDDPAAIAWYES